MGLFAEHVGSGARSASKRATRVCVCTVCRILRVQVRLKVNAPSEVVYYKNSYATWCYMSIHTNSQSVAG